MPIFLMGLHVLLLNLDEYLFNKKRGHSPYETVSVISDGILFLIPLLIATFVTYSESWVWTYKILAGLSMLSVVKNEFFYRNLEVKERFIHACLYVLHPMILFTFYESWTHNYFKEHTYFWMVQILYFGLGMKMVIYQLIYWNYIHEKP
ncbi:MAG: hypothetical protein H6621_09740 [Halobacteriovoraceae bacterium]|nr:hypothetical protein [Halobacteriovoraceae bacterium]MCB9095338.1 hypothetical protein [Halobacteriovoraceae bacterium]